MRPIKTFIRSLRPRISGLILVGVWMQVLGFAALQQVSGSSTGEAKRSSQPNIPVEALNQGKKKWSQRPLIAGTYIIRAEIAQTNAQRVLGLSGRTTLAPNKGMLFIWPTPARYCMWMKDTQLSLTALFLADDGTVKDFADMLPYTTATHCAPSPVRYILEVGQSWPGHNTLSRNIKVKGLPR